MLETYESAAAQGFPRDYQWGPLTTFNLMVVGNSVSPPVARSLAAAVVLNVTPIVANYLHLYRKHTSVGFRRMLLVHTAERAESVGDRARGQVDRGRGVRARAGHPCRDSGGGWSG